MIILAVLFLTMLFLAGCQPYMSIEDRYKFCEQRDMYYDEYDGDDYTSSEFKCTISEVAYTQVLVEEAKNLGEDVINVRS